MFKIVIEILETPWTVALILLSAIGRSLIARVYEQVDAVNEKYMLDLTRRDEFNGQIRFNSGKFRSLLHFFDMMIRKNCLLLVSAELQFETAENATKASGFAEFVRSMVDFVGNFIRVEINDTYENLAKWQAKCMFQF